MPMGVPLPPEGDTSWYDWATAAHALLNALNTMSAANAADYALLASPTFTGNVIVPAADSAGEPIVYNQAGARLNGLLSIGDITINKASASLIIDAITANAGITFQLAGANRKAVTTVASGELYFFDYNSNRNAIIIDNAGAVSMFGASNVYVPNGNAASEALAYDQAGARLNGAEFTGDVRIDKASPILYLDANTGNANIVFQTNGAFRKTLELSVAGIFRIYDYDSSRYVFDVDNTGSINMSGAANVFVPDANADGEALAYDQVGARVRGLTVADTAATLEVTSAAGSGAAGIRIVSGTTVSGDVPYVTFVRGSQDAFFALSSGNNLYAYHSGSGRVLSLITGVGEFDASGMAAAKVPAATAATHAAQVSAIDAATGRLAIGGREIGDTGLRKIATWTAAGVVTGTMPVGLEPIPGTAGYITMQRTENVVEVKFWQARIKTVAAGHINLPTGFGPTNGNMGVYDRGESIVAHRPGTGTVLLLMTPQSLSGTEWWISGSVNDQLSVGANMKFLTTQAWPATLPGFA